MTEFNLDLGKRVLEQITLNPKTHNQADSYTCVLGWTTRLADSQMSWWCYDSTRKDGARLLGVSPRMGWFIYNIMGDRMARMILAHLVAKEERRRYRADHQRQHDIDKQARAQVRAVYALVEQEQRSRHNKRQALISAGVH